MGVTNSRLNEKRRVKSLRKRKRDHTYEVAMLLKYWKTTRKEPIRDLCMIIAMYMPNTETGSLYAVGGWVTLTKKRNGNFKSINTLTRILLQNKDGKEVLIKSMMNGSLTLHAFLFEHGTMRIIESNGSIFDIALKSDIIRMNSGNYCNSLFVIDMKMRAYKIKDGTPIRVTKLPNGIKIKDISCGIGFTIFLSECGQVFGIGSNSIGKLGLSRKIKRTKIPNRIIFSNINVVIITIIHASMLGWVAVDLRQRAWIIGNMLMKSIRDDYESLNPCISIIEVWNFNEIKMTQIKCGYEHVIALDTKGRVYWFGRFDDSMPLSYISLEPISFLHRIIEIRSGLISVACKDAINEWYIWGCNSNNHITGLCGCKRICKRTKKSGVVPNPMKSEWKKLFDTSRVVNLELGLHRAHVIVDSL